MNAKGAGSLLVLSLALLSNTPAAWVFEYDSYAKVLERYVNNRGLVDYRALKNNRGNLDMFVGTLASFTRDAYSRMDTEEQIAFWINAYNGLTLRLIVDHYPIQPGLFRRFIYPDNSIRQIPGAWDTKTFAVMGEAMTLDHIEHEILRRHFYEPRIHFALVCASLGCAELARKPYRGNSLDSILDAQTRVFLANPDKFRIDRASDAVYLSRYFDWYGEDFIKGYLPNAGFAGFGKAEQASLSFIAGYLSEEQAEYLRTGNYRIEYLDYDWSLNEQK